MIYPMQNSNTTNSSKMSHGRTRSARKLTALLFVFMFAAAITTFPTNGSSSRGLNQEIDLVTNPNESRMLPRAPHDPQDIESFLKWAKDLAQDQEVLMAYASSDYKVLAYNCILSLQKVGVENAGILTLDDETVDFFVTRGIAAYNVAKITKGVPEDVQLGNNFVPDDLDISRIQHQDWSSRWNTKTSGRWQHWMLRHYLALRVLKEGVGVYQTDVDMVFVNNPYTWLDPAADLEGQSQNWPKDLSLNLGIGHIKASLGGVLHWETTNNMMRYMGDDPQSIENLIMLNPLIDQVGTVESKPCREDFAGILCTYKSSPMINYRVWDPNILPMGYDTDFVYPADNVDATAIPFLGIHVHATRSDYQNRHGKTKLYTDYCKQHGVWFIPEEEENVLLSTSR